MNQSKKLSQTNMSFLSKSFMFFANDELSPGVKPSFKLSNSRNLKFKEIITGKKDYTNYVFHEGSFFGDDEPSSIQINIIKMKQTSIPRRQNKFR